MSLLGRPRLSDLQQESEIMALLKGMSQLGLTQTVLSKL